MTIGELKEWCENFGNDLRVVYVAPSDAVFDIETDIVTRSDPDGHPCAVIVRGEEVVPE
jgi:hypothetical protein